ncbi:MAG: hypothetical protein IPP90_23750 [Gemmatimonadaceae bacterium]|nr:hypothetical protein [Gemmatimonadaceae bacterium]
MPRALADNTRLRAVSLAAGRAGVRAGMTLPEAQARCATLDVRTWDDHAVNDAVLAVTTAFLAASPRVTPVQGAPGMWWITPAASTHWVVKIAGARPAVHCATLAPPMPAWPCRFVRGRARCQGATGAQSCGT